MAISLKKNKKSTRDGNKEIEVLINNGHIDYLEKIVEKYDSIKNEAQALDFIIKSVGYDDEVAEGITVNGVVYTPDTYEQRG